MTAKRFDRYEVKSELGQGGMATVYQAYDPRFGRNVALKVMNYAFRDDPTFRGRFEREARTVATLEHPAIVPVYDFGEDHDQLYLVMRYMPGGSLADRIIEGPLPLEEAVSIVQRIGAALDHAHQKGVIHRDLKPANILFDQYGNPFLSDFGIVKLAEATTAGLTGSGVIGTPAYMSPEQIHSEKALDGRSDIYTLGIILFEMLTGLKPYRADTPVKQMMAHVLNPIPSICDVKPELPEEFDLVIQRALAKEREARFSTAGELTAALARATGTFSLLPHLPTRSPLTPASPAVPDGNDYADATETAVEWLPEPVQPEAPPMTAEVDAGDVVAYRGVSGSAAAVVAGAVDEPASDTGKSRRSSPPWRWLGAGMVAVLVLIGMLTALPGLIGESVGTPTIEALPIALVTPDTPTPEPTASPTPEPTASPTPELTATRTPRPTPTSVPETPLPEPETQEIGVSALGTPITAVGLGSGESAVILIGGIHAGYAPASVELAQMSIDYFSQHPELIPVNVTLYVVPNLNPDSPLDPGRLPGRLNSNGVDLNRNWDCRWQEEAQWNATPVSGGAAPFSEPEVQAMADFITEQEAAAVVFWEARSTRGLVSPGRCGASSNVSADLAQIYGAASGYEVRDFERLMQQEVTGDGTNWLDQEGIPAIAVLLPQYSQVEEADWENNLAGMLAVLDEYREP
ncbi:MAG TPA: protein kinase [Anaerolineae bacterium]